MKLGALPFQRSGEGLQAAEIESPPSPEPSKLNSEEIDIDDAIDESDDEPEETRETGDAGETEIVVQPAGIIDDELDQASGVYPSVSVETSPTLTENDQPFAEPDSPLEPAPGYKPRPPTATIIAQLDNVSYYLI